MAVSTQRLRLVTFNIAHGRGLTPIQGLTSSRKLRLNLRRIADLLAKLGADVVALQEIDERSVWSGNFDHLDYLRAHAGFPYAAFGINNRRLGVMNLCYGNAILSRYPIVKTETVVFGERKVGEKGFLFASAARSGPCRPSSAATSTPRTQGTTRQHPSSATSMTTAIIACTRRWNPHSRRRFRAALSTLCSFPPAAGSCGARS